VRTMVEYSNWRAAKSLIRNGSFGNVIEKVSGSQEAMILYKGEPSLAFEDEYRHVQ
jgi:hypothetical protein